MNQVWQARVFKQSFLTAAPIMLTLDGRPPPLLASASRHGAGRSAGSFGSQSSQQATAAVRRGVCGLSLYFQSTNVFRTPLPDGASTNVR